MAFFKNRKSAAPGADAPSTAVPPAQSIENMRQRAKHRLIGAALLVLLGVVGFPLLFDSQPRPVAVDIPIEIPDKGKVKPLVLGTEPGTESVAQAPAVPPAAASEPGVIEAQPAAQPEVKPAPPVAAAPVEVSKAQTPPAPGVVEKPAAKAAVSTDDGAKAAALLEGKEPAASAAAAGRFVVQVGAFTDAAKLREVRQKLEKSGLKTYTQVVTSKEGKRTRVRVGPFPSQAEADAVVARIKALELPAAVLKM